MYYIFKYIQRRRVCETWGISDSKRIQLKKKKQKTKTLKYQNDVFENKLTFEFKRNTS